MMKRKFIILAVALTALTACKFDDYDVEYPTKRVLFTYQTYNRQLVVGEGLEMSIGFVFSGLPSNDRDRVVYYTVDESLITDDSQSALPSDYYELENPSQITIPKGSLKAYMPVLIDSAKFVDDPKSLTGEYVLAVRITDADVDEISDGKDYTLISLSYYGKQHGNYTYVSYQVNTETGDTTKYYNQSTSTNSIRQLQTVGVNKFRVYADQIGTNDPAKGLYSMIVTIPILGGGAVTIEPDTEYLPDIVVEADGESYYDESSKVLKLNYKYTSEGVTFKASDSMTFRNRVRDDQGDGRVLYEWRGF